MINDRMYTRLERLKSVYDAVYTPGDLLFEPVFEREILETVYNSNAIEGSTLTLAETEKILLEDRVPRDTDVREVYEARNLANILRFLYGHPDYAITPSHILELDRTLIFGIDDFASGSAPASNPVPAINSTPALNFIPVKDPAPASSPTLSSSSTPVANSAPEDIQNILAALIKAYASSADYFLENIAQFHARFEYARPFTVGNGQLSRLLVNLQLSHLGYPPIIIPAKSCEREYRPLFDAYRKEHDAGGFAELFSRLLCESLHRRLAYALRSDIIKLTSWARINDQDINTLLNAARRQTVPAFRERGIWMISADYDRLELWPQR